MTKNLIANIDGVRWHKAGCEPRFVVGSKRVFEIIDTEGQ